MSTATAAIDRGREVARPAPRLRFSGMVRAEARKLLGQRSTLVMLALWVLVWAGVTLLLTLAGKNVPFQMRRAPTKVVATFEDVLFNVFTFEAGVVLLLTSARLVGMEYSAGTIRVVLARGTGRISLLLAKLLVLAGLGVVMLAVITFGSAVWGGLATLHWTGSLTAITSLPGAAFGDIGLQLLMCLISVGCAILIGTAAATVGRSVAFGVGVAMAFYPADNDGTSILFYLLGRLTGQPFWSHVTAYFLGPNLNVLPSLWITNRPVASALRAAPLVKVDLTHALLTIGVWALALLVLQLLLTWRRDVTA
ncbi:MAG: ABC transporter permease subunit [Candidatus Dormibacteraceae bacterium]